jgi:hypothetical protein
MPPARRLVTLLAVASLAAGALPAAAFAQDDNGAGDQQYQDPFGSSQTSTPAKKKKSSSQGQGKKNGLSQTPNLGASGTAGTSTGSSSGSSGAGSLRLAKTGGEPGPLALIGVALLLGGIGLRLRTADERR